MPEPEKKTPETNPTAPSAVSEDKLADSIVKGLRTALPEMTSAIAAREKPEAPIHTAAPTLVAPPSPDDIAEATIAGDKAKLSQLLRQQAAYDAQERQRGLQTLSATGGQAIGALARQAASALPYYGRFKKDIDGMVADYLKANPGTIATIDMYERAHDIVKGQHTDELIKEARDEAIRKARNPEPPLSVVDDDGNPVKPEPKSLSEVLKGDWNKEFREKIGSGPQRSEEDELHRQGYRGGFAEFMKTRKEMEQVAEETNSSFGLDRDWVIDDPKTGAGHWVN